MLTVALYVQPKATTTKPKAGSAPYTKKTAAKKEVNPLFEKNAKNFGIGTVALADFA